VADREWGKGGKVRFASSTWYSRGIRAYCLAKLKVPVLLGRDLGEGDS
jgi:hypothetical protein